MGGRSSGAMSDESGTTLIEIVAAIGIGMVVLMAGLMLLDRAVVASHEIADRQEAVQRGRQAMELITRQLRSQVCLGENAEPIAYGDGETVVFYADLGDGTTPVERRTLGYEAPQDSTGRIVEQVEPGEGVYPDLDFDSQTASSRVLLSGAQAVDDGGGPQPVFRYYAFQVGSPTGDLDELPTPLDATDASRTVMVRVAFVTLPDRIGSHSRDATTLQDDVYVRIADPTRPLEGPRCL